MAKPKKSVEQRFWAKVIKTDTCWFWIGATDEWGYGKFNEENKTVKAHRYSYKFYNGPIPEGLVVRHICNNPSCVNPSHLILGTQKDNVRDQKYNPNIGKQKSIKLTREEKIERRFWTYVNKNGPIIEHMETNCWEWTGGFRGVDGYGGYWNGHTNVIATRYIYELVNGPIAEGMFICHKCDNPKCIRLDHLFEGSPRDNVVDRVQRGRQKGKPQPGSKHHNSKLTEQDVIDIRNKQGIKTGRDLAKEYSVSESVISEILSRKTWVHI